MPETFADQVIIFDQSEGLSLIDNSVDEATGIIKGVSLATAGVEAIGHGEFDEKTGECLREFWTDESTLETMLAACVAIGQPLKAKLEHGTGLSEIVGEFDGFRIEGAHLRADFTAYPTSSHKDHLFTLAKRLSKQFGVSVTAMLQKVSSGGIDLMRCVGIESADFVDSPAINAGLFSKKQKNHTALKSVSTKPLQHMEEKEVKALLEAGLKPIQEQLSALAEGMPKAPTEDEMAADTKAKAELAEAEEAAATAQKEEMSSLKSTITALEAKLETATAESKELGVRFGATLQEKQVIDQKTTDFAALMAKKTSEGKSAYVALSEMRTENLELCQSEAARRGLPSINML